MSDTARAGNPATRYFADRKVGTKVLVSVGALAVVAGSVGVLAVTSLGRLEDRTAVLADSNLPSVAASATSGPTSSQARTDVLNHAVSARRRRRRPSTTRRSRPTTPSWTRTSPLPVDRTRRPSRWSRSSWACGRSTRRSA